METTVNKPLQTVQKGVLSRRISKKKPRKQRQTSWNLNQQIAYVQFLKKNSFLFKKSQSRKKHKVFKQLSDIIGTRSSIQVKSHHQKLEQKYNSTYNIILHVGNFIKQRLFQQQKQKKVDFSESLTHSKSDIEIYYPFLNEENSSRQSERLIKFIFEDQSQDYDPISACIVFDDHQPLI